MNKLLTFIFCLVAAPVFAASPSFQSFDTNQFGTGGNRVVLKDGVLITNVVFVGGNGGGLSNVTARYGTSNFYSANLSYASTFHVTNYGVVLYVPNTITAGSWVTNGTYTDNFVAMSNLFLLVSNSPAPRVVDLGSGILPFSGTLTWPPLTDIVGRGSLHKAEGTGRTSTGLGIIATNNFSVLWWIGSTNGTAIRAPYHHLGRIQGYNFEVCGSTNPLMDSGAGFVAGSIAVAPLTNLGFCAINFDAGTYGGGFVMDRVNTVGFRIGVIHAGNDVRYEFCQFIGCDIPLLQTNVWAVDQVTLRHCSIAYRQGGQGYWIAHARGWKIEQQSDIDYFGPMVTHINADIVVQAGNVELNSAVRPTWTVYQATATSYYFSNDFSRYSRIGYFMDPLRQNDAGRSVISVTGGQYSDGGNKMNGLFVDYNLSSATANGKDSYSAMNVNWDTTNQVGGISTLVCTEAYISPMPDYVGNPDKKTAPIELWGGYAFGTPRYKAMAGVNVKLAEQARQVNFQRFAINGGVIPSYATNESHVFHGVGPVLQLGWTTTADWLEMQFMATSWASGIPTGGPARVMTGDVGPRTPDGQPNTNLTVEVFKYRTGTNLNTSYIPTNTAAFTITTNDFVMNQFYTNVNQRALVSACFFLANSLSGTDVAKVNLYLDQEGNGSFERTEIQVQNALISVNGIIEQLDAWIQPNGRFMFTNTSTAGTTSVSVVPGSSQWVRQ